MKKHLSQLALALLCTVPFTHAALAADAADIVFVVDESGSMAGEHSWISSMVTTLESQLIANGVGAGADANRYALVGFGALNDIGGHTHTVGSGTWGDANQLSAATSSLEVTGDIEDGWDGIDTATSLNFRSGVAKNIILITDEDRDAHNPDLSFGGLLSNMIGDGYVLNAVVNHGFEDEDAFTALGIDHTGGAYIEDGFGGYFQTFGGLPTTGFGTTESDYIDLALISGGAAWDLNLLRLGGTTADAFTQAFVDVKAQEIAFQETFEVPLPAVPFLMFASLLGGLPFIRRRERVTLA